MIERRVCVIAAVVAAMCVFASSPAVACPFCNAVSQTMRQEMQSMDAVVIAVYEGGPNTRNDDSGETLMKVTDVLFGEKWIKPGQKVVAPYFGDVQPGRQFMLSGVDPPSMLWSSVPLTETSRGYVKRVADLSGETATQRLKFYYAYLNSDERMLSRDAYNEFAVTPYEVIEQLRDVIKHDDLVRWLEDPELPTDRRRLYLTLLGVVGNRDDLPMLERMLRSEQKSIRAALDALVGSYLTLAGEKGLPLVEELFLTNPRTSYTDTYAAVMALRFHGTEADVIPRSRLTQSLHHLLTRPELADLIIPDLARWGDWSQIQTMKKLFLESDEDNTWVRVPVINYLRACPKPEAEKVLAELTELDPDSVRRANTYFSIPVPARDVPGENS